jgi:hypothetical protein
MPSHEPPDLNPTHDIAFLSHAVFDAMAAFGAAVRDQNGALLSLSVSQTPGGHHVRARLADMAPEDARRLTDALARRGDVAFAAVEHVIWRRGQ